MSLEKRKIYDLVLRFCHLGIGSLSLFLILSAHLAHFFYEDGSLRKSLWTAHVYAGYCLISLIVLRFVWGFIGPQYAKWKEMWKWDKWIGVIKKGNIHFEWAWGHHPLASFTYLIFYIILTFLSFSGITLAAIEHNLGPLASLFYDELEYKNGLMQTHEALSFSVIFFIFAHLYAIHWHEKNDHIPIAQSMFTGNQYRKNQEGINENKNL